MLGTKVFSTSGVNLINIDTTSGIYQKTTYDQYGTASNLGSYQEGNTVLITGPEYSIEKTSACTGTVYDLQHGRRAVESRIQASAEADKAFTVPDESATVADDTPAGLILKGCLCRRDIHRMLLYGGMGGDEASFTDGKSSRPIRIIPSAISSSVHRHVPLYGKRNGNYHQFQRVQQCLRTPAFYTVYDIDGDNVLNGQTITNTVHIDGDGRPEKLPERQRRQASESSS